MISDRELWACANKMIQMHGLDAGFHAATRADELLASGDLDGQRTWKLILARIEELQLSRAPLNVH
jgi:hypothetical protein